MATKINKLALVIGLAGAFAMMGTASFAKSAKQANPAYPKDSYEAWGATPGKPPVPGFALSGYKPGLCWKVWNGGADFGRYVPCSEWKKK